MAFGRDNMVNRLSNIRRPVDEPDGGKPIHPPRKPIKIPINPARPPFRGGY